MRQFLIIARSARALAASAKRAGHKVHCLDCFTDEDTKQSSVSVNQLHSQCEGFVEEELLGFTQELVSEYPDIVIVTGSGFESRPGQINQLRKLATIFSNSAEAILELKTPERFSELLLRNSIKHPSTFLTQPKMAEKYLIKKIAGIGGVHVQWPGQENQGQKCLDLDSDHYYQEYISGEVLSAVFLANGKQANIVGFNQQLQTSQFDDMPFLYQGAVSLNSIDRQLEAEVFRIINVITNETGLNGLCGLDFILDDAGDIYVLEVNPRPPATYELHEHGGSLFDAHLACFETQAIDYEYMSCESLRAYAILYANHDLNIVEDSCWPDWVKDRPAAGSSISYKFPVCTVHAEANSVDEVRTLLFKRLDEIESKIMTMQNAA